MSLRTLASELETTDRTLRRALRQGTLRGTRPSARKLDLPLAERVYLRRAWPLLAALREALRTEPAVGLAVLFGSRARGDERSDSDVDLVVALRDSSASHDLTSRLSERLGLRIHIVSLDEAENAPLLLAAIVRDGRVLVDRTSTWPALMHRKPRILRAAARERRRVDRAFDEAFTDHGTP
jgi:predicted nucleotidyltransferase